MNILKANMAKTGKTQVLGSKFSKMTAPNFGPNSLCGPSTVFQGRWPNQGGAPEDPPKKTEVAMWKLQLAIWKLNMALGKLEMAIWKIQMAIGKLKSEPFEAKNVQKWQNGGCGPQIVQNDSPQFWAKFFIWP